MKRTTEQASQEAASGLPPELSALVDGGSPREKDASWARFVARHSLLLLRVAHSATKGYDRAMEHYTHILDELRADDFKRLRAYVPDERTKFTTWLVVVARRLCLDNHRRVYGRFRVDKDGSDSPEATRRRLAELLASQVDPANLPADHTRNPEREIRAKQLLELLASAVATLDPEDRLLLRLKYQDELPAREIGHLLEIPTVFHVYRRINKLLTRLRTALKDMGVSDAYP